MASATKPEAATSGASTVETAAKVSSRRMHFPYTFTAQIVQFPYKYYFNNAPLFKFYGLGLIISLPIFWKFQKLARSPANCKKWDEIHEAQRNHPHPWDD